MKANEAPEKIYLNPTQDALTEMLSTKVKGDIEYTRTDSFIEKACEWLSKHFYDGCYQSYDDDGMWIDADGMIEDFEKYMKGE